MTDYVLNILRSAPEWSALLSIALSIVIGIIGILPSVFLTTANIVLFGPINGFIVSLIGECAGAMAAFFFYRIGFQTFKPKKMERHPLLTRLQTTTAADAFWIIISLRILPFMPSGLVTFVASISNIHWFVFLTASSLGKIPALLIESFSVLALFTQSWLIKPILVLCSILLLFSIFRRNKRR
ncbi:MAG: TVP38/TMEM64 family protein [Bacilli bacterium]